MLVNDNIANSTNNNINLNHGGDCNYCADYHANTTSIVIVIINIRLVLLQ